MRRRQVPVLYSFPHPLGVPGISTTAVNQIRGLIRAGAEVHVYTTSAHVPLPGVARLVTTLGIGKFKLPHRSIGLRRAYRYHDRVVASAINRHPGRFDVVHAWPRSCIQTFAAARSAGVVSFRESPSPHTASAFEEANRAASALALEVPAGHSHREDRGRLAEEITEYGCADFILAPSDYVVGTFVERGVPRNRLIRHRYGFDPVEFPEPELTRPSRPFTACFVGRGEPNKGLHHALRAWSDAGLIERGRFLIAGNIQPDYGRLLRDLLESPGVQQMGFVRDIAAILRESDILVLPTATEGSALVVYEAIASGVVPLVSDAAGASLTCGREGLVHAVGDVVTLAEHLRRLAGQPDTLQAMREACVERRHDLSWTAAGQVLLAAYEQGIQRARDRT